MKTKLFQYITGAFLILSTSGCEKFLEHDHPTSVTDEKWWNVEADATNALAALSGSIPGGTSGRQLMFLSALSDEAVARQDNRGRYEQYAKGLQGPDWDKSLHYWRDDYKNIRRACRFLENVDKVYMLETLKTRYKYEARAIRAYQHMELSLLFGGIPIVTKSLEPDNSSMARNTKEEVYDFVVSELTECANNLPNEYPAAENTRPTAGWCWALISRMALFYNKYDVARDACKKIIDIANTGVYALYKSPVVKDSYANLFLYTGELNKERIFFSSNGSSTAWVTFAPRSVAGITDLSPTAALVNAYETKQGKTIFELGPDSLAIYMANPNYRNNRDPRFAASILIPNQVYLGSTLKPFDLSVTNNDKIGTQSSTATGFWINKYLDPKDRNAAPAARTLDFMIIRYAEILLSYAESLIELGQWNHPDVVNSINAVRNRAGMPNVNTAVYNSQTKLRELVRRERQVELAFEAVRYYDIRRWGILEEVMNGQVYGAVDPATSKPTLVEVRSAKENRDFYWPIPQGEILANPLMKQNPNY